MSWLDIIGIGEDGMDSLSPAAATLVREAEIIFGGDRHLHLASDIKGERFAWPSPFDAMIEKIRSFKGRRIVVLASGDPLWYSVGARIGRAIPPQEICYHPQLSAFQYAACRMGWSLADVETLTVHGRPAEQIIPWFYAGARLLILTKDGSSPQLISRLLCEQGYEQSRISVLAAMGGKKEQRFDGVAQSWSHEVPDLHTLAVELIAGADAIILPKTGLPDEAFHHDGKITKQAVRALTLARLAPQRGQLLWDIGIGCGSVAIEWMRAAREARALGIEANADRRALAARNALALGTPALQLIDGKAPLALHGLAIPDAIFIGGGVSGDLIDYSINAIKPGGRLVANGVTLASEAVLGAAFEKHGGELQRVTVQRARPIGKFHGWKSNMPVTQWAFFKPRQNFGNGENS